MVDSAASKKSSPRPVKKVAAKKASKTASAKVSGAKASETNATKPAPLPRPVGRLLPSAVMWENLQRPKPGPTLSLRVDAAFEPASLAPGEVRNLGPAAGSGSPTATLGVVGTDLCEIAPSGLVALGGDTFSAPKLTSGWSPSIGLHVRPGTLTNADTGVQFDRAFGQNNTLYAEPLALAPNRSQLPAGTIQVFGIDYALVTNVDTLHPLNSRLVRIDPNNGYWPTVPGSYRDASWQDFNQTQISGYQARDGWVYIVADAFDRGRQVWLYRCPAQTFSDRNTWHAWGIGDDGTWAWDVAPTPLSDDTYGELSLRLIDDKAVLSGFNSATGRVEVRVADDPTQVLNPDNSALTVIADQEDVPQNYGGYIVPGSTLDQAHILVSQWNNADPADPNSIYNVQEFVANLNR